MVIANIVFLRSDGNHVLSIHDDSRGRTIPTPSNAVKKGTENGH